MNDMTKPLTFTTLPPLEKKRAFWTAILGPKCWDEAMTTWLYETPQRLTSDELLEHCKHEGIDWSLAWRRSNELNLCWATVSREKDGVTREESHRALTGYDALAMALFKLKGIEVV